MSQQYVYDLAHSDLAYYFKQCLDTIQEAERMIWETYRNKERFTEAERKERYQLVRVSETVYVSIKGEISKHIISDIIREISLMRN